MFKKRFLQIISIVSVLVLVVSCSTSSISSTTAPKVGKGFFANSEINRLVDENYKLVVENGWAELRIPQSVHGITKDAFSPNALDAAEKLIAAGYEAYLVGGSIRDLIMGTPSMDFDITTTASNEVIKELFDEVTFHSIPLGHSFAFVHYPDEIVDVATCVNIPAGLHGLKGVPDFDPEPLYSNNFVYDSFQRDLTMNAIYYDVKTGDLVDYHGGIHDIREGVIKTMVEPEIAMDVNSIIAVRSMRFKARYNMEYSPEMDEVMHRKASVYSVMAGASSNAANMPKFFNAGYALRCYYVLRDYDAFGAIYSPVADMLNTDAYQNYITSAFKWMDDWYASGNKLSSTLSMAVILWPAVINNDAEEVLEQQNKTIEISDEAMDDYLDLFEIERKMTQRLPYEEAVKLALQNEFEDAYQLLIIRTLTERGLEAAARFWTSIREIVANGGYNRAA